MRIGLSGAHSTGKTTAARALYERLNLTDEYVLDINFSRKMKDNGLLLNKGVNDFSQMVQMNHRLSSPIINKNMIMDRTIYDVFSYTRYAYYDDESMSDEFHRQFKIIQEFTNLYDIIFLFYPYQSTIEEDGVRDSDIEYRNIISGWIEESIKQYSKSNIIEIPPHLYNIENFDKKINFMVDAIT